MSDPIKILEIEEHEDGSATLQVECDPETFAAIFNVGFVSLIKAGLHWETNDETPVIMRRLAPVFTAKDMNMDVKQTMMNVLGSSAAVEIMNELVLATLKSSLDTCAEMRLKRDGDRGTDHLTDLEMEDWNCLVQDIAALNRAIDYYGG